MPDNLSLGAIGAKRSSVQQFVPRILALVALVATSVFAFAVVLSVCVYYLYGPDVDFVSFWAAGRLTLGGHPSFLRANHH